MQLIRGDTGQFKFQRAQADGTPIVTPADKVYFTVKRNKTSNHALFQKVYRQEGESDMELDNEGFYHFVIEPEDTDKLPYGTYYFDIEVITGDIKSTISVGTLNILPEITFVSNEV